MYQPSKKECLEYHIGNCDAPCINKINEEQYKENIISLKKILDDNETLGHFYKKLETEMKIASDNRDYEESYFYQRYSNQVTKSITPSKNGK